MFILWFSYYVSDIFCKILGSWMTTYLGKSCSFCLPRVPFVNCRQFVYLVISLLVLRAGYGIWLYQFLIIAYLFTLIGKVKISIYCYLLADILTELYRNVPWFVFCQIYSFCSLNKSCCHGNRKDKFPTKYSNINFSEAVRRIKLKLCRHSYSISLYNRCIAFARYFHCLEIAT